MIMNHILAYASDAEDAKVYFNEYCTAFNSGDYKTIDVMLDKYAPTEDTVKFFFVQNHEVVAHAMNIVYRKTQVALALYVRPEKFKNSVKINEVIEIKSFDHLNEEYNKSGQKRWFSPKAYNLLNKEAKIFIAKVTSFGEDNVLGPVAIINKKILSISEINMALIGPYEYASFNETGVDEETGEKVEYKRISQRHYELDKSNIKKIAFTKNSIGEDTIRFKSDGDNATYYLIKNWKGSLNIKIPRQEHIVFRIYDNNGKNLGVIGDGLFENSFSEELANGGYYIMIVNPLDKEREINVKYSGP